ncbi:sulfatase [Ilumatobacter sp.]|uniref:sulfatase family protein n=1 Tax=Ilumatobacter sp. TaxID=1967498 RepID=UPI003B5167AA
MSTRRPNIAFVLTDDHAAHSIGAYGSVLNETPRIDEIARDGVVFDNCFVTNSLCTPSRASILTGTYSHVNGVFSLFTPIDASQPTFVSQLRDAGYRTAMFGKWHMGHGPGHDPEGFDHWDVVPGQGDYWDPTFISADGPRTVEGYATDIITDLAIDWVESLDGDEPWCVLVWHKAPHRPWEPKPEHRELYESPRPLPSTFWDDHSTRSVSVRRTAMRVADHLTTEDLKEDPPAGSSYEQQAMWKYQRYMRDYLACVHSVDENVGRLTDWLRARDELDDTMVLYSSDQGFFLGDHGWFDKRLMFEESLRMPLLVSYPRRVAPGRTVEGIVTNVDLAQTILDAAGVDPHERMQGRSSWPELVGDDGRDPVPGFYYRYWENDDVIHKAPAHYGYRTERYKLIYYYNDGHGLPFTGFFTYPPEWELYDLEVDPDELRNVVDDPAYAEIRDELAAAMWREQSRLGDAPHPSQPVPPGCADVPVAALADIPRYRWLDAGAMDAPPDRGAGRRRSG